jgi:stress-induced-phosphoprotein 1
MQVMQMDPRFMDVFKELTGLDLGKMQEERSKNEVKTEDMEKQAAENQAKRQAEEAARKKAEEEAALPNEEREKKERAYKAEKIKLEGNEFYKKKNFAKAIELYSQAIEMNPAEIMYYSNLAAVYIEEKKFDQAIEQCEIGITVAREGSYDFQKLAKVMARKAAAYEKKGDMDGAIAQYKSALLEDNAGSIKDSLRRCEKLKKEADAVAYINPEIANEHKDKGNELFKAGSFPAAIKEFDEGARRDPKNKAIFSNRCACYLKLMDPHAAIKDAERALAIDPLFVRAWSRKGTAHQMTKEYHKAM